MRWQASAFWKERGDVPPSEAGIQTSHDVLWAAFTAGALEAEALPATPEPGFATVRVSGLGWWARGRLKSVLNDGAPIGTEYRVEKLPTKETG